MKNEELEYIKKKGTVLRSDLSLKFLKSKDKIINSLAEPLKQGIIEEEAIGELDSEYTYVGETKKTKPNVPKDLKKPIVIKLKEPFFADTSRILGLPKKPREPKYVTIKGIGRVSVKLLSHMFEEKIMTIDIDKLIKSMKTSTLEIDKDKISFNLSKGVDKNA